MAKSKKPNLFIVGAPKCGTTSLYEWLKQHPDVYMSPDKEPMFFCKDIREMSRENESQDRFDIWNMAEYKKLFQGAGGEDIIGEGSTWYLYSEVAAKKIKEFSPEAKIIIMLRDPVEQIVSSYDYGVKIGSETAESLEEALELEEKREKNPPEGQFPYSYLYRDVAKYAEQIARYQKYFPPEQIKVILLDDLKSNPEKVYQGTLAFLEVEDTSFIPDFSKDNTGALPRFPWLNKAIKHPESPIRKLANLLPYSFARNIRRILNKILLSSNDKTDPGDKLRKQLKKELKPDVKKTSQLINRDLMTLWSYSDITTNSS